MAINTFCQTPTPGYYVFYGNPDVSPVVVTPDFNIEIKLWVATPPDTEDSVAFMHNPLASNDSVITDRNGGSLFYPLNQWFDVRFETPNPDTAPGYTNQSLLCFSYWPFEWINTGGDTIHIASFEMHTTPDSAYIYELICPFIEGYYPDLTEWHGLIWGLQDGTTPVFPDQSFSCLFFVDYYAGDANGDGLVNGLDVVFLVNYFRGSGPTPDPMLAADANGDCMVNGLDVLYLVAYFKGGPEPFYGDCY